MNVISDRGSYGSLLRGDVPVVNDQSVESEFDRTVKPIGALQAGANTDAPQSVLGHCLNWLCCLRICSEHSHLDSIDDRPTHHSGNHPARVRLDVMPPHHFAHCRPSIATSERYVNSYNYLGANSLVGISSRIELDTGILGFTVCRHPADKQSADPRITPTGRVMVYQMVDYFERLHSSARVKAIRAVWDAEIEALQSNLNAFESAVARGFSWEAAALYETFTGNMAQELGFNKKVTVQYDPYDEAYVVMFYRTEPNDSAETLI